ncbi:hypothetical protein, partial [Pseudomonas aeruginosa]
EPCRFQEGDGVAAAAMGGIIDEWQGLNGRFRYFKQLIFTRYPVHSGSFTMSQNYQDVHVASYGAASPYYRPISAIPIHAFTGYLP